MQDDQEWCHFTDKIEVPLNRPLKNHSSTAVAVSSRLGLVAVAKDREVLIFELKALVDKPDEVQAVNAVTVAGVVSQVVFSSSGETLAVAFESSVAVFSTSRIFSDRPLPLFAATLDGFITQLAVADGDILCALTPQQLSLYKGFAQGPQRLEGVKCFDLLKDRPEVLLMFESSCAYVDYTLTVLNRRNLDDTSRTLAIKELSDKQIALLILKQNFLHELWVMPPSGAYGLLQIQTLDDSDPQKLQRGFYPGHQRE
jgi:hypothetical protein